MNKRQVNIAKKQQVKTIQANKKIMQDMKKSSNKKYEVKMNIIKKDLNDEWLNPNMNNDASIIYANAIKMVKIALKYANASKQAIQTKNESKRLFNAYIDNIAYYGYFNVNALLDTLHDTYSDYLQELVQVTADELFFSGDIDDGYKALNSFLYDSNARQGSSKLNKQEKLELEDIEGDELLYITDIIDYNKWLNNGIDFLTSDEIVAQEKASQRVYNFIDFELAKLLTPRELDVINCIFAGNSLNATSVILDITGGSVNNLLKRARKKIIDYLDDISNDYSATLITLLGNNGNIKIKK